MNYPSERIHDNYSCSDDVKPEHFQFTYTDPSGLQRTVKHSSIDGDSVSLFGGMWTNDEDFVETYLGDNSGHYYTACASESDRLWKLKDEMLAAEHKDATENHESDSDEYRSIH